MIPKVIHYCWFGQNPLPDSAKKCIQSWKRFFPNYEIKEWNEDNFDVNIIPYTAEAYIAKKYAFVSDYARFWILYHHGGLYFDTDVEVIKSMDEIVKHGNFMGIEVDGHDNCYPKINPGLGLGLEQNNNICKSILDHYSTLHFLNENGEFNNITVVTYTTNILKQYGLKSINCKQQVENLWIYPKDFFNPLDDFTGKLIITPNTLSIHWYTRTWSESPNWRIILSRWSHRVFGMKIHKFKELFK